MSTGELFVSALVGGVALAAVVVWWASRLVVPPDLVPVIFTVALALYLIGLMAAWRPR